MPTGVFNARSLRNSDGVKPKLGESPNLNSQPPEKFQGTDVPGPYVQTVNVLVILRVAKDLSESFDRSMEANQRCFASLNITG